MTGKGPDDGSQDAASASEDLIGSTPDRFDAFVRRLSTHIPQRFGRTSVLAVALIAVACGVLVGRLTMAPDPTADLAHPDAVSTTTAAIDDQADSTVGDLGRGLLTVGDLAAIGEVASGGTYTRGSASALPNSCSPPDPGDVGVSYVPGPAGATSVSFRVAGGTLTERITEFPDEDAAAQQLFDIAGGPDDCTAVGTLIDYGSIGPDLGNEYLVISVDYSYPTGVSRTVSIVLVRVGATVVEFALTTSPGSGAESALDRSESGSRCLVIAAAGISS